MHTQAISNKRQGTSRKATSMAELMKKTQATPFISPHKGDMLTGTITNFLRMVFLQTQYLFLFGGLFLCAISLAPTRLKN